MQAGAVSCSDSVKGAARLSGFAAFFDQRGCMRKGHTHKEVIVKLQGSIAVCYAVLLFLCRSMVCLFSSCSSSPIKFHTICIFCLRCPLDLSGAWTMIFFTNSLTIVGVSSRIPTYLRIIAAKLSNQTCPVRRYQQRLALSGQTPSIPFAPLHTLRTASKIAHG